MPFCTQIQRTTETDPFPCRCVQNGFLVSTTSVVTEFVGWFGNSWPVCTRDLKVPSKIKSRRLPVESNL